MFIPLKTKGETVMKRKLVVTVFISALMLSLSGCNSNIDSDTKVQESNTIDSAEPNEEEIDSQEENEVASTGFSTEYTVENAKDGYFIVSKLDGALYGLLDSYGNEVLPLEYDNITFPESSEAKAVIVEVEGKKGVFDYKGNEIFPVEYDNISSRGTNSTMYLVQKENVQRLMTLSGEEEKKLQGTYDAVLSDAFLVQGFARNFELDSAMSVYSLDEELLCKLDLEKEDIRSGLPLFMEGVDGLMEVFSNDNYSSLMDKEGKILYTTATPTDGRNFGIYGLENNNLFRIYSNGKEKLYNLSTGQTGEEEYKEIIYADKNLVFAVREDGNVDVYDMNGEKGKTLDLSAEHIIVNNNTALIVAKYGETYRIYDKDGNELSDNRYLDVEPIENYWLIQNLEGEYGLIGPGGEMVIPFGEVGEETYNGLEWKDVYSFNDTFCIVTESSSGSNVWLFAK